MKYEFNDKSVKDVVARRHPDYKESIEHWRFCEMAYRGGRAYVCKDNVFQFYKEGPGEFSERLKRTYRVNHVKRVVETINQYLFKQRPQRSASAPYQLIDFWARATKRGDSMDVFSKQIDLWLSVFGIVYAVVDRPAQVVGRRVEEKLPYSYIVFPTHVFDASYDDDGRLNWILIAEDYRDDNDPTIDDGETKVRIRLWTKDEWYLFAIKDTSGDYSLVDAGEHGLGVVPVVPIVESASSSKYAPAALISDISYMDRTLANYGSLLDQILYEQTYSQLVMPAEGVLPGTKPADQLIAAAKQRIFLYAGGSDANRPGYISPDASQATLIMEAIDRLKREIYASTGTDAGDANSSSMSKGREYASGKVRAMDHSAVENMLLNKAQGLEKAEDDIARLVLMWMGQGDVEVLPDWVRYPMKFDVRGLVGDLEIALQLNEIAPPAEVMRLHMIGMAEKLFPRLDPSAMLKLVDAIDAWTPAYSAQAAISDREVSVSEDALDLERERLEQDAEQADLDRKTQVAAAAKRPEPKSAAV